MHYTDYDWHNEYHAEQAARVRALQQARRERIEKSLALRRRRDAIHLALGYGAVLALICLYVKFS